MEAQLLRDMIADRDKAIEKIKKKSQQQIDREKELKQQLQVVRRKVKEQEEGIRLEKMELLKELKVAEEKLVGLKLDFSRQGSSLRNYCQDTAADKAKDESYVMRMQAQLCKAMHSMGITDNQMELVQKQSEAIVKYQKEQLAKCTDQKTEAELKHMNELMAKDTQTREDLSGLVEELERIQKEREGVERQLEENRDSDEDSDSDAEESENDKDEESEDEEERQIKEELMKILAEKREEIDKLEKEREEQEEVIAEMEDQLAELKGLESPRSNASRKMPVPSSSQEEKVQEDDHAEDPSQESESATSEEDEAENPTGPSEISEEKPVAKDDSLDEKTDATAEEVIEEDS